jgi:hypothetical protein
MTYWVNYKPVGTKYYFDFNKWQVWITALVQ